MQIITEEDFKEKIKDVLIVQFSAAWCGPCKTLTKTIDNCEDELSNQIYKMDIDANSKLAGALGIRSVPTIIRFEKGKEVNRIVGNQSSTSLKTFAS
jgi:thioredoxin